jgi:hypothetical protein
MCNGKDTSDAYTDDLPGLVELNEISCDEPIPYSLTLAGFKATLDNRGNHA